MNMREHFIMKNLKECLAIAAIVFMVIMAVTSVAKPSVGGTAVSTIAGTAYALAGAGISSSDTSITLTSFTIPQTGYEIQDSDLSETFYITIEPGSRSRQEIASCTTVTQNSDNTATFTGCSRGLSPFSPYTASTTYAFSHSGGSTVIFSNPPQLYEQAAFKANDETITGTWLVPTPLSDQQVATKKYVDDNVSGGTVSNDRLIMAGTAGETVATGTLVYFNGTDQEWYKADGDDESTFKDKFIGLTQGAGTDGAAITDGVLIKGRDTTQTGLTAGSRYFVSATAGEITTVTTSLQPIGEAEDIDVLYFDPLYDQSFDSVPAGTVVPYATTSAPVGWLLADGSSVATSTYPRLFNTIGYTYGGSGASFNLPDLSGRNVLGYGSATTTHDEMGETGGEDLHTLTEAELPAHSHDILTYQGAGSTGRVSEGNSAAGAGNTASTQNTGSGTAHNVLDPFIVLQYIIKY